MPSPTLLDIARKQRSCRQALDWYKVIGPERTEVTSMVFSEAEMEYLAGQMLGRLATVGSDGTPQVRPLGLRPNAGGTIDLGGRDLVATQCYRNVLANPRVGFVVDDMTPDEPRAIKPGMGGGVEIRGRAETFTVDDPPVNAEWLSHEIIRIHPSRIVSWQIDRKHPNGQARDIGELDPNLERIGAAAQKSHDDPK